jgi:hypothetical protein
MIVVEESSLNEINQMRLHQQQQQQQQQQGRLNCPCG